MKGIFINKVVYDMSDINESRENETHTLSSLVYGSKIQ
jgi:hypothetical protein